MIRRILEVAEFKCCVLFFEFFCRHPKKQRPLHLNVALDLEKAFSVIKVRPSLTFRSSCLDMRYSSHHS